MVPAELLAACYRSSEGERAAADQRITATIRTAIAPLTAITPKMLRDDGMGRQSFAQAKLELSVPEAVTVLAVNLMAFPAD